MLSLILVIYLLVSWGLGLHNYLTSGEPNSPKKVLAAILAPVLIPVGLLLKLLDII